MVFQGTLLVGCLELGIGRRWINTQGIVVFGVFDHFGFGCLSQSRTCGQESGVQRRGGKGEGSCRDFVDVGLRSGVSCLASVCRKAKSRLRNRKTPYAAAERAVLQLG